MTGAAGLRPTASELREMARLAAPIVAVNLGMHLMGVVDTLMLGRVSATALAAGALGNLLLYNLAMFGLGLLFVLDPVIAQGLGAGDAAAVARGVQRGVVLAALVALPTALGLWWSRDLLLLLRQPPELLAPTVGYARWSIAGLLPFFWFWVQRSTLQAFRRLGPILGAVAIANVVNAAGNWVLIYGHLGAPPLGVVGSAHATWVSRWVMAGLTLWFGWDTLRPTLRPWRPDAIAARPLGRLIALGVPIGLQMFFEVFAFGFATFVLGWFGTATLAGHEIALNLASLTFMVPMGVAGAAGVMVGRAIGAGDMPAARRDAAASFAIGAGFMLACGIAMIAAPEAIARAYTTDLLAAAVAVALLPIAGLFQLFDGVQVVASSVLRATGDTRWPAVLHMAGFWGVGIPVGLWLAFRTPLGAPGLWWGLAAGLAAAAVLQVGRVRLRLAGEIARLDVDGRPGGVAAP